MFFRSDTQTGPIWHDEKILTRSAIHGLLAMHEPHLLHGDCPRHSIQGIMKRHSESVPLVSHLCDIRRCIISSVGRLQILALTSQCLTACHLIEHAHAPGAKGWVTGRLPIGIYRKLSAAAFSANSMAERKTSPLPAGCCMAIISAPCDL